MRDANKVGQYRKGILYERFPKDTRKKGHKTRRNECGNMAKSYFIYCIEPLSQYVSSKSVQLYVSFKRWPARALHCAVCICIFIFYHNWFSCIGNKLC